MDTLNKLPENPTGLDILNHWLDITYIAFQNQADSVIKNDTMPTDQKDRLLANAAISMRAINVFKEKGIPNIRTALDLLENHRNCEITKISEDNLSITQDELTKWQDELAFCQTMLRGKQK